MAKRPIFLPYSDGARFVEEREIEFEWNPGFAPSQKRKNILALHTSAEQKGFSPLLEVSTKSENELGKRISAFNLPVRLNDGSSIPLECAFQGSKVFEEGGPFNDLFQKTGREAKKDPRIRESGNLIGFRFEGVESPREPKTAFYDWLYARAMGQHPELLSGLNDFVGFSDIEFNPGKSFNCQARSCAIVVSLVRKGLLGRAVESAKSFIDIVAVDSFAQPYSDDIRQGRLF